MRASFGDVTLSGEEDPILALSAPESEPWWTSACHRPICRWINILILQRCCNMIYTDHS